jgi:hypothetical protein
MRRKGTSKIRGEVICTTNKVLKERREGIIDPVPDTSVEPR